MRDSLGVSMPAPSAQQIRLTKLASDWVLILMAELNEVAVWQNLACHLHL